MSRSSTWLRALAPPQASARPTIASIASAVPGQPCAPRIIPQKPVTSRSDITRGFVSVRYSRHEARGTGAPRKVCAVTTSDAANAVAASPACTSWPGTSAAAANRPPETRTAGTSRRCATQAQTSSATSGGATSAASSRCAVPRWAAPLTTASSVPADATSAVRRSQAPGAVSDTDQLPLALGDPPAQVAQRPRARHVGDALEVPGGGRRSRVPLERVRAPRVVAGESATPRRDDDVRQEDEHRDRHHAGADRRDQVVGLPETALRVRVDAARHSEQPEHVLRQEGEVEA